MSWLYPNARRSAVGSWLRNLRDSAPKAADTFVCGVRVVAGELPGEDRRWRFRLSAADELVLDDTVTIQHGKAARLRLRLLHGEVARGRRPNHLVISATEVSSGATVEVSLPAGEVVRFGLDGL